MMTLRSRVDASEVSTLIAVNPPTTASAPGTGVHGGAQIPYGLLRLLAVGRGRQGRLELDPPVDDLRRGVRLGWAGLRAGREGADVGHARAPPAPPRRPVGGAGA